MRMASKSPAGRALVGSLGARTPGGAEAEVAADAAAGNVKGRIGSLCAGPLMNRLTNDMSKDKRFMTRPPNVVRGSAQKPSA